MKNVLILGAGQSTPHLISYMLDNAEANDWFVTVCDLNVEVAKARINGNTRGHAVEFDINDEQLRQTLIEKSDIVINMLAPKFQYMIALDCLRYGKHFVSASYEDVRVPDLNKDANRKGIIILNEMGLDPGIDHMSAMAIISNIRKNGGIITSFISYGSGLPAPEVKSNPLRYCITWNPRNITMAGSAGAQYMEDSKIKIVPHSEVFKRTWEVDVDGVGVLEAYPNRDSLVYKDLFKLHQVDTMIRATLRYPGWSETWSQIIKLGIPNEVMRIPSINDLSFADLTEMFLPLNVSGAKVEARVANFLGISPTGKIMDNLRWLGLFSDKKIPYKVKTSAEVMTELLREKMPLPEGARDMVILVHEISAYYPQEGNRKEKTTSTLIDYGEDQIYTAISRTVGLPAAIAAKLILTDKMPIAGCHIPTHPQIYTRVMDELEKMNIKFNERVEEID